jgi:cytochrome d ubiquinol oxidase subunit II
MIFMDAISDFATQYAPDNWLMIIWYVLIAVLWIGFFVLEGFDFGVGMLYQILSKNQPEERRVMVNAIGPTWDGNEVWLLTAGGATFAAFPGWYATLFSGLYLPLFLVLMGLIIRGISFEYRALNPSSKWRDTFDWLNSIGSFIVALVFGVGFANFVKGIPLSNEVPGSNGAPLMVQDLFDRFLALFTPFALLGGVMLVVLFLAHGAQFLCLKTAGVVEQKARAFANKASWVAAILVLVFVVWANFNRGFITGDAVPNPYIDGSWLQIAAWAAGILSVVAIAFAALMGAAGRDGLAFFGTALGVGALFINICTLMYGTLGFNQGTYKEGVFEPMANPLNIQTAASSDLTLNLMFIFACILVPIVLLYIIWAYWIMRKRLSVENLPANDHAPVAA